MLFLYLLAFKVLRFLTPWNTTYAARMYGVLSKILSHYLPSGFIIITWIIVVECGWKKICSIFHLPFKQVMVYSKKIKVSLTRYKTDNDMDHFIIVIGGYKLVLMIRALQLKYGMREVQCNNILPGYISSSL